MITYTVQGQQTPPGLQAGWEHPGWAGAETAEVSHFLAESSNHHPRTQVRLVHDGAALHGIFRVEDRFVRCVRTGYFAEVWKDSCVEFFVQPLAGRGYLNFEFNCGGAFLCSHIRDPERVPGGFKDFTKIPPEVGGAIRVVSSLPPAVDPEVTTPVVWTLRFVIPRTVFEHCLGPLGGLAGQAWRGNFYKCAEEVSHPHWAAWSPVDRFDFHRPGCFGRLRFLPAGGAQRRVKTRARSH